MIKNYAFKSLLVQLYTRNAELKSIFSENEQSLSNYQFFDISDLGRYLFKIPAAVENEEKPCSNLRPITEI